MFEIASYDKLQSTWILHSRSTISTLTCVAQAIAETLDSGGQVEFIYTDFSKAFTTENVTGLTEPFIRFFLSHLSNRKVNVQ